jgi:Peptidase A4 family
MAEAQLVKPDMSVDAAREYLKKVKTFKPPASGFDPFRASARELALYGFPRRPDREREPELYSLWERAFAHPHQVVRAELAIDETLLKWRADGFGTSGWGGVIVEPSSYGVDPPEPVVMVYAEWMVPAIVGDPTHPTKDIGFASWIGLNGYIVSDDVLQAGVAQQIQAVPRALFEWYPGPPVMIDPWQTFPVRVGDRVAVLVCAPRADHGFVSIQNKTTRVITNIGVPPPRGFTSEGTSAEWIVEEMSKTLTGPSDELPDFGAVVFTNAVAGTKHHRLDLSRATTTEIVGTSGKDLTKSSTTGNSTAIVIWEGFN